MTTKNISLALICGVLVLSSLVYLADTKNSSLEGVEESLETKSTENREVVVEQNGCCSI
jgi:hypothetical protein